MPGLRVQFSSDDRLFGPEYSGNKIRLWRLAGGRELRVLRPAARAAWTTFISPVVHADGRMLAAAARHQLCFFDLASGEELASVRLPLADAARPVFFDPPHLPRGRAGWEIRPAGGSVRRVDDRRSQRPVPLARPARPRSARGHAYWPAPATRPEPGGRLLRGCQRQRGRPRRGRAARPLDLGPVPGPPGPARGAWPAVRRAVFRGQPRRPLGGHVQLGVGWPLQNASGSGMPTPACQSTIWRRRASRPPSSAPMAAG